MILILSNIPVEVPPSSTSVILCVIGSFDLTPPESPLAAFLDPRVESIEIFSFPPTEKI